MSAPALELGSMIVVWRKCSSLVFLGVSARVGLSSAGLLSSWNWGSCSRNSPIRSLQGGDYDSVPSGQSSCRNGYAGALVQFSVRCYCSSRPSSRAYRKRVNKRLRDLSKPTLDEAMFRRAVDQLPPRFSPEELSNVITLQDDPLVCLELFNWASQQPRFRHNVLTYDITIKKLGAAKMYEEMDGVVNQVLAVPHIGTESVYNTMIYYFTEARKLTRAVSIFKRMKKSMKLDCRPSIRTYNLLFAAFLSTGKNSYINHVYMETLRGLFRQMVDDCIEPDIFALNCMIKGYVLSLHVNDALRIFHQMGTVYGCQPNSFSYDYLIHGLCSQGRTMNAREMCDEMKQKGFVPSSKSYNSLVNALAMEGEFEDAKSYLEEMIEKRLSVDFITHRTILDEMCRRGKVKEAMRFLRDLREKNVVDWHIHEKLQSVFDDDFGNYDSRTLLRCKQVFKKSLVPIMLPGLLTHGVMAIWIVSRTKFKNWVHEEGK
ncbi:hypothetical protein MLD38_003518 [Melastoma candidum]|uniref:Uncharacterized protein n=1 Tax=Melastoma candidum TaxID=119954 RepID=A0ACB9S2Z2_9MYRT|nr:hypothetical protein MLD38_003518 [Melastoma candidum]